jgi:16S rRNA (cytosine967-C5)-methyltransferase
MYADKRLEQALEVLKSYAYPTPFAGHLKTYFRAHKNMGGRDRRELKNLLYAYLRLGRGLPENLTVKEKIALAAEQMSSGASDLSGKLFPADKYISDLIDKDAFIASNLEQPLAWVRVKKDLAQRAEREFETQAMKPAVVEGQTYGFEPDSKLTDTSGFKNGWFWIQDKSSQETMNFISPQENEIWWDACAGAGGKSLTFREKYKGATLIASDVRTSILENLHTRHRVIFGKKIESFAADLGHPVKTNPAYFDGIIIDAPCTGSGTWARNPEHLLYFNAVVIADFTKKQIAILQNAWQHLKPGKTLLYITCSVFAAENEEVIAAFSEKEQPIIEEKRYLEGYRDKAETMFVCRMKKPTTHA